LRIGIVAAAFVLAALTYQYVELPVRKKSISKKHISLLLALMGIIGGLSLAITLGDGLPGRFADKNYAWQALDADRLIGEWGRQVRRDRCHLQERSATVQAPACVEKTRPLLLLWGDSHAASLYPGLNFLRQTHSYGIAQLTQSGCPPLLDVPDAIFRPNCNALNNRIFAGLGDMNPDAVVLAAAWIHEDYPMSNVAILDRLTATVDQIKQAAPQAKIIVVGPMLRWPSPLPAIYRRALTFDRRLPPARLDAQIDPRLVDLDNAMRDALAAVGVGYLSPIRELCDAQGCLTRLGDGIESLTFIDAEHVAAETSYFLAGKFAPDIFSSLGIAR
jgi:hypothetical protein